MPDPAATTNAELATLQALAQVQGQLTALTTLIHNNADATNRRIDDFRTATETRFTGIEGRLGSLEKNERNTALRTAALGASSGAVVAAALALLKAPWPK